ncbi:hypothetical protein BH11PAT2_BH11PAT2_02130 [soil metagenome]
MNEINPTRSVRQAVLDKIRTGEVRRRPRAYFLLRVATAIVVSIVVLVVSVLVISFILFSVHESGEQFLLGFGGHGIQVFLQLFPWALAITAFVLLLVLEWVLRGFKFSYRIPLLNVFLGIVGVSVILSVLINFTPFHAHFLQVSNQGNLPVVGSLYEHVLDHHEDQGVYRGEVTSSEDGSFVMKHNDRDRDHDDGTFTIHTKAVQNLPRIQVGDDVLVFGELGPGYIVAEHIQVLGHQ